MQKDNVGFGFPMQSHLHTESLSSLIYDMVIVFEPNFSDLLAERQVQGRF